MASLEVMLAQQQCSLLEELIAKVSQLLQGLQLLRGRPDPLRKAEDGVSAAGGMRVGGGGEIEEV